MERRVKRYTICHKSNNIIGCFVTHRVESAPKIEFYWRCHILFSCFSNRQGDYASIMGFTVLFLDGPGHNTPDPWSSSNGLPTSTYPSMLPGNSHHSQAYPSMHHSHDMVRSSPVGNSDVRHSPGVMVAQWLGNNPPSSSSSSVPSSRHHPQQVGIAIGIAVYSCHHFLSAQCVVSRYASDFGLGEFFYSFSIKNLVVLMEISL